MRTSTTWQQTGARDESQPFNQPPGLPFLARQSNKITLNCPKRGVVTTIHTLSKAEFIEKGGYAIWLALYRAEDVQADNVAGTFPNPVERGLTIEVIHEDDDFGDLSP